MKGFADHPKRATHKASTKIGCNKMKGNPTRESFLDRHSWWIRLGDDAFMKPKFDGHNDEHFSNTI